jgi:hypothetical protein
MLRRVIVGAIVSAVMISGGVPAASAGTTSSLLLPQSTAFSMLGHSCGGIQEQAFTTGFDATSGYPTGDVYLQTRCGGSGRGGGYHSTTYSAWAGVTWDFTAAVVSSTELTAAPTGLDPAFSAFDGQGNEVFNTLNAVNVLPADCTVGNTAYCTYRASLTLSDTFVPPPRVTAISVVSGPATGATTVTITGSAFTGATAVSFGATPASSFTIDSDTSITAVSPPAPAGAVDVTVTSPGGTSPVSTADQFTFVAAPTVTGIAPPSGPVAGGTAVTITGTGFTGATSVAFGDVTWFDFTVNSDTSITAVSPPAEAPDTTVVTVTTLGGTSAPSAQGQFTYTAAAACTGTCLSVGDASILEGDSGNHVMTFTVTLSQPATTTVSVQYAVTDGTATGGTSAGGDTDFQLRSGTLTFTPSAKTGLTPIAKSLSVTVYGDTVSEADETFAVTLSNPTPGFDLARPAGIGTILNDDPASGQTLGIGDRSIAVASSGSESLTLPVTLSSPAAGDITVDYVVTPDTAVYSSKSGGGGAFGGKLSGSITISLGKSMKTISVPIWPGTGATADETFTITLTGVSDGAITLIRATGTGTILAGG